MGQSLVQNYMHVVFSTKNLVPLILPDHEKHLFEYLGGICKNLDSPSLMIGGHLDHVHILCRLSKKISIVEFAQKIKSHSSKWMKTKDTKLDNFYWQDGYGAFSVSPNHTKTLVKYIANQHEHHQATTFQKEYVAFLKEYDLDYKEEYLW